MVERRSPTLEEKPGSPSQPVPEPGEPCRIALELAAHGESEPPARALEPRAQVAQVGHDESSGRGRRGGPDVGGQIAERRVLLVPDGGDNGHGGCRDGPDDRLVAEREEILEAPASARENYDVHLGVRGQCPKGSDDRSGGSLALNASFADDDLRGRKAPTDGRHEIAARGRIRSGQDPDRSRKPWEWALPRRREEPFRGELPLQMLEREEMPAEADALYRRRPEAQLALQLVQLGAT